MHWGPVPQRQEFPSHQSDRTGSQTTPWQVQRLFAASHWGFGEAGSQAAMLPQRQDPSRQLLVATGLQITADAPDPHLQAPSAGSQVGLIAGQVRGVPETHRPSAHWSPTVQAFPSEQVRLLAWCTHPVRELHESFVQTFPSSQLVGPAGWQTPWVQMSPSVQASPSLQGVSSGRGLQAVLLVVGWQDWQGKPGRISPVL